MELISDTSCCCVAAIEAIISMMEDVSVEVSWWEIVVGNEPTEADDVPAEGPGKKPAEAPGVVPTELPSTSTLGERVLRFLAAGPSPVFVDDFGLTLVHVDALPFVSAADLRADLGLPLPDMFTRCGS